MQKQKKQGATRQLWFLYEENDDGDGHFNAITNIRGLMGVPYYCSKCLGCFSHQKAVDKHVCLECTGCKGCNTKQQKSSFIGKERAHYLRQKPLLGGKQELDAWVNKFIETHNGPPLPHEIENTQQSADTSSYIVYDFEADASTNTHEVNHAEIDILCVNDCYEYDKCLQHTHSFDGYNTLDKFCDWLSTDKAHST